MAPAAQIFASALLVSFGFMAPESVSATSETTLTHSILSITAITLGSLIVVSFVTSRLAGWIINR